MTKSEWPIVVGGCHRSGTSLVRRILNAHSRIYCGPEIKFFLDFFGGYLDDPLRFARFFPSVSALLPRDELFDLFGAPFVEMHEILARRHRKARWADKNPENVLYLEQWQRLLGDDWLFVHVVRNPLDTIASIKEVKFSSVIPSALEERISFYARYARAGVDFALRHPERSFRVLYEDLVTSPRSSLSALMSALGEQAEEQQLDFAGLQHEVGLEDPKIHHTDGIHAHSIGRWKEILTVGEAAQIAVDCSELWKTLDLDRSHPIADTEESMSRYLCSIEAPDPRQNDAEAVWTNRVHLACNELREVVPPGEVFSLIDEEQWGLGAELGGRLRRPFPERNGVYAGPPPDNQSAMDEIARQARDGASFLVVSWPAFWWLDHYRQFYRFLCRSYRCIHRGPRLIVFSLKEAPPTVAASLPPREASPPA